MMEPSERVTLRLSSETMDQLRALVRSGEFSSVSEAVGLALDEFMKDHPVAPELLTASDDVVEFSSLVHEGTDTFDDDFRSIVRSHLQSRTGLDD